MPTCICTSPAPSDPHDHFMQMLPIIRNHAHFRFRHLPPDAREEALQEVECNAYVAYARLLEQGRPEAASGTSLAHYAVAQYFDGRRVGMPLRVRDVMSPHCQKRKGVKLRHLHRWDEADQEWKELVIEDRNATPADLATLRIDFAAWLRTLSSRWRKVALTLASGESTLRTARRFRLSPGRISQLRRQFAESWRAFHGEEPHQVAGAAAHG